MQLTRDLHQSAYTVRSYQSGIVCINEETYTQSLILTPTQIITDWPPKTITELKKLHLERLLTQTPTLVIHGAQDYRVPDAQGLAYYNTLKARGVDARLLWFPDENHWVLKPPHCETDWLLLKENNTRMRMGAHRKKYDTSGLSRNKALPTRRTSMSR